MIQTSLTDRAMRAWEGGAKRTETVRSFDSDLAAREVMIQKAIAHYQGLGVTWKGMTHDGRRGSRGRKICQAKRKPVICVELNKRFNDTDEAAGWLRRNGFPKARRWTLTNVMREGVSAYGFHWRRPGEEFKVFAPVKSIAVRCMTTGKEYLKISDAVREDMSKMSVTYSAAHNRISRAAGSGKPDPTGRTWEFLSKEAA